MRSMNYLVQKPGDVSFQTYSLNGLRVAVASGQVQLDWQARHNGKEMTVTEALKEASKCYECYECGKEISSLAAACPSCGASPRAAQPSLGSTTASSALDFHFARQGRRFGPYTEVTARNYLADGRIGPMIFVGDRAWILGCRCRTCSNFRLASRRRLQTPASQFYNASQHDAGCLF